MIDTPPITTSQGVTAPAQGAVAPAVRGWLAFDGTCGFCQGSVRWMRPLFEPWGFGFIPMQTPWVSRHLGLELGEVAPEMKLIEPDGTVWGGAAAFARMARCVWWLWPVGMFMIVPGIDWIADRVYRLIAGHRYRIAGVCSLEPGKARFERHQGATTFFEPR